MPDLVHAVLDLLIDGERGIWHLANAGAVTWAELARLARGAAGVRRRTLAARPRRLGLAATRPAYGSRQHRGTLLRRWMTTLRRHAARTVERTRTTRYAMARGRAAISLSGRDASDPT